MDEDTIKNYYARYEDGNLMGLLNAKYISNKGLLNAAELRELETHLREITYRTAKDVIYYIQEEFNETYSLSGVHELLKRLGFVYKKPQHASSIKYGWIKRGENKEIFTTAVQKRLTINGIIDIKRLELITNFQQEMVTTETVKDFLELLRKKKPKGWIYLLCDNACYYHNDKVKAYAKSMGIKMIYLPAYSPSLNSIERVWLYFKKSILYNCYYATFAEFEMACRDFFVKPHRHKAILKTLLTENFQRFAAA